MEHLRRQGDRHADRPCVGGSRSPRVCPHRVRRSRRAGVRQLRRPGLLPCRRDLPAEIAPEPGREALCFFYHVDHPGTTWRVPPKLLWEAELVSLPNAGPYQAVVSMRGDLVLINGQTGGRPEHSVVIYSSGGKLVKSYPLASLVPVTQQEGGLPVWGWHIGARLFFLRQAARFYILLPRGRGMEFNLNNGTLKHGNSKRFPELAALAAKQVAKVKPHTEAKAIQRGRER